MVRVSSFKNNRLFQAGKNCCSVQSQPYDIMSLWVEAVGDPILRKWAVQDLNGFGSLDTNNSKQIVRPFSVEYKNISGSNC